jgi:hypothetical protein
MRQRALVADGRLSVAYTPAIRAFLIIWFAALVIGSILLSVLAARGGF